jgi:hypothetical protein
MESRRKELRRRIQEAHKNPWIARRYDGALKRAVTEYGRERQQEGATIVAIEKELGLPARACEKWLRQARLQIAAGKTPFEPRRKRSRTGQDVVVQEANRESESPPGEGAEQGLEARPELSAEPTLVLFVRLSDVHVESAAREQLCEWLRGQGQPAPTRQVARERGRRASART